MSKLEGNTTIGEILTRIGIDGLVALPLAYLHLITVLYIDTITRPDELGWYLLIFGTLMAAGDIYLGREAIRLVRGTITKLHRK